MDAGLLEDSLAGTSFPAFSIGISDPSAIRMAGSYATFADSGKQRDLYSVKEVTDQDGTVFRHEDVAKTKQAFSADVADNVTDVLKTVVEKGTGSNAQLEGREVAGKTGTTDGNKSAWFVGYTPQLSTSIGMYRMDDDESNKNRKFLEMYGTGGEKTIHGASFPSEIWHDYMEQALEGKPAKKFPTPEPIGKVINDVPTPTVTPSTPETTEEPSPTPSATPSRITPTPTPTPSNTCDPLDFECNNNGGHNNDGTDTGGTDGDVSPTPTETESGRNGRGDGNGGLFGGGTG